MTKYYFLCFLFLLVIVPFTSSLGVDIPKQLNYSVIVQNLTTNYSLFSNNSLCWQGLCNSPSSYFWKNDGTSTATGDWDIDSFSFSTLGNVSGGYIKGNGAFLTGISTYNSSYVKKSGDTMTGDLHFGSNNAFINSIYSESNFTRLSIYQRINNFNNDIDTKNVNAIEVSSGTDYCDAIPLHIGWNAIALTMENETIGDDRNYSIVAGWNLIGMSTYSSININKILFVIGSTVYDYPTLHSQGLLNISLATGNSGLTQETNNVQYLRPHLAYWVKSSQAGNLTLTGIGGTVANSTYAWNKLRFVNGSGVELNILTASLTYNWIDYDFNYWNTSQSQFKSIYSGEDRESINSLEGIFIYSNQDNLNIIRQNSTCSGTIRTPRLMANEICTNNTYCVNVSSIGQNTPLGYNPFNQVLNTTSNVIFNSTNISSNIINSFGIFIPTGKILVGNGTPVSDISIIKNSNSGGANLPSISIANTHVSTASNDYSFAGLFMGGNNSKTLADIFVDGSGFFNGGVGALIVRITTNNPMLFYTNSVLRMAIEKDGKVGIGRRALYYPLEVNGYTYSTSGFIGDTFGTHYGDNSGGYGEFDDIGATTAYIGTLTFESPDPSYELAVRKTTKEIALRDARAGCPPEQADSLWSFYNGSRMFYFKPIDCHFYKKVLNDGWEDYIDSGIDIRDKFDTNPCYNTNYTEQYVYDSKTGNTKKIQRPVMPNTLSSDKVVDKVTGQIKEKQRKNEQ